MPKPRCAVYPHLQGKKWVWYPDRLNRGGRFLSFEALADLKLKNDPQQNQHLEEADVPSTQ